MPRRALVNSLSDNFVRSRPSTQTSPDVGFSNMFTQRMRVLLPAPDDPITPKICPCGTCRLIFDSACIERAPCLNTLFIFVSLIILFFI